MNSNPNHIEIDAVEFQISCRRFAIRATITRDRQLPVVDEFVLRLLAVLERMSVARMRGWFGFSESELETVLIDMSRRRLIEFDSNEVVLASAGRELFQFVGDGNVPHLVEVLPLMGDVWFDLVSRSMVERSRSKNLDYLVKVLEQTTAREFPEAFAREAFEENFKDYARRIRRFPDPESVNLYSISDVEGGAYGYQVLPATLVLDLERMSVRPTFPELVDATIGFQKLTLAANRAWQAVLPPDTSAVTASEFERMTGEDRLARLIHNPGVPEAWLDAIALIEHPKTNFKATVGASYLTANISRLIDEISKFELNKSGLDLIWLRPSGSTWGRTNQVADGLKAIRDMLHNVGQLETDVSIVMPRSTHKSVRNSHRRLFDRGLLLPQGHLPSNLEVLLLPGVAAYVGVHLAVGTHSVPIGGVVTDPKRLGRIAERLKPFQASGWEETWIRTQAKSA